MKTIIKITTDYGASYEVREVPGRARLYQAWVTGPVEVAPLHRDHLTLPEACYRIALCVDNATAAIHEVCRVLSIPPVVARHANANVRSLFGGGRD